MLVKKKKTHVSQFPNILRFASSLLIHVATLIALGLESNLHSNSLLKFVNKICFMRVWYMVYGRFL